MLSKLTTDMANISKLPNTVVGQAATLKAEFDKAGNEQIKTYINDTLTTEIDTEITNANNGLAGHKNDKDNPHEVTKNQVGLSNVDNAKQATKEEFDLHTSNKENPHEVEKSQVGLGNVDNTSDLNKPISTATQAALDLKADQTDLELTNGGLAALDNAKEDKGTAYSKAETYNRTEIDNKLSTVYKYKGSVNTYAELPNIGQNVGDVYNVISDEQTGGAGVNYAWDGTGWDNIGGIEDLSNYFTIDEVNGALSYKSDKANTYTKTETNTALALKTDKTYTDTELERKVDKYTGEEPQYVYSSEGITIYRVGAVPSTIPLRKLTGNIQVPLVPTDYADAVSLNFLNTELEKKSDKEPGKSLVPDTEISKLATVAENANNYMLPTDVVQDNNYVHTDNNFITALKNKVENDDGVDSQGIVDCGSIIGSDELNINLQLNKVVYKGVIETHFDSTDYALVIIKGGINNDFTGLNYRCEVILTITNSAGITPSLYIWVGEGMPYDPITWIVPPAIEHPHTINKFVFETFDGGVTWYGNQCYSVEVV